MQFERLSASVASHCDFKELLLIGDATPTVAVAVESNSYLRDVLNGVHRTDQRRLLLAATPINPTFPDVSIPTNV